MLETDLQCEDCGTFIQEEWEVYGETDECLCVSCWFQRQEEEDRERGFTEVYGIAPHHHDLLRTGSIIGSTVDDPLPDVAPDAEGFIRITATSYYKPDTNPDGKGMGMWRYYQEGREPQ